MSLALVLVAAGAPLALGAQDSRRDLIEAARREFSDSNQLDLLMAAMSPAAGPPDSLWTVAAFDMAQTLILRLDRPDLAQVWLVTAVRHGRAWPLDRAWGYAPPLVRAYDQALATVGPAGAGEGVPPTTAWQWPERFDADAPGALRAGSPGSSEPVSVAVGGREPTGPGQTQAVSAGVYRVQVSAVGFEAQTVDAEVLPGVTTVLTVDLPPLLPLDVERAVAASVVSISSAGSSQCTTGWIATSDGLVLTRYRWVSDEAAGALTVAGPEEAPLGPATVAATDSVRDLAVLVLSSPGPALVAAEGVDEGQYAWSLHFSDCSTVSSARTRVAGWEQFAGPASVSPALPGSAGGAPLVDRTGAVVGTVTGPELVIPVSRVADLLEEARTRVATDAAGGGGFPVGWVAAGLGGVAVAVALLVGGGDGESAEPPSTGSITVTFPGSP